MRRESKMDIDWDGVAGVVFAIGFAGWWIVRAIKE